MDNVFTNVEDDVYSNVNNWSLGHTPLPSETISIQGPIGSPQTIVCAGGEITGSATNSASAALTITASGDWNIQDAISLTAFTVVATGDITGNGSFIGLTATGNRVTLNGAALDSPTVTATNADDEAPIQLLGCTTDGGQFHGRIYLNDVYGGGNTFHDFATLNTQASLLMSNTFAKGFTTGIQQFYVEEQLPDEADVVDGVPYGLDGEFEGARDLAADNPPKIMDGSGLT